MKTELEDFITERKDDSIYKMATLILASALITLLGAYFASQKNVVTREELPGLIEHYNPYTQDQKDLKNQVANLQNEVVELRGQVRQLQTDVGNISAKLGVTASPGGRR